MVGHGGGWWRGRDGHHVFLSTTIRGKITGVVEMGNTRERERWYLDEIVGGQQGLNLLQKLALLIVRLLSIIAPRQFCTPGDY